MRLVVTAALLISTAGAQESFEVASVKPSDPNDPYVVWNNYPGGRVVITNYTLDMLIEAAYGVSLYRVAGAPYWVGRDVYSITAKAPSGSPAAAYTPPDPTGPPPPEICVMMRSLLVDRFGLKVHLETRHLPVMALTVGKGGPKFSPAPDLSADHKWRGRGGEIEAHNQDMEWLTMMLERHLGRTVVNLTGLTGSYDFTIKFDPRRTSATVEVPDDPDRPPLADALRSQLGLTLKESKQAVEVLVVDEARKPSAN